jgi:E3 ubiquitin-protein ligase UBR4
MSTTNGRPSPTVMENITLPCLKILQGLIKAASKDKKDSKASSDGALSVDVHKWIAGHEDHSFAAWEKRRGGVTSATPASQQRADLGKASKSEVRAIFLQEKYFKKWRRNASQVSVGADQPDDPLVNSTWLKNVLFNSSSRLARQVN